MYSPTRRNRNIGTENQGYGQNNKLTISSPYGDLKSFYARLTLIKKKSDRESEELSDFVVTAADWRKRRIIK